MVFNTKLDLEKNKLYCFENGQDELRVANMIRGIEAGDSFDPIPVLSISNKEYALINGCCSRSSEGYLERKGGHHTSLAHFIAQKELSVEVFTFEDLKKLWNGRLELISQSIIPLSDLTFTRNEKEYICLLENDPNYKRNHHPSIIKV